MAHCRVMSLLFLFSIYNRLTECPIFDKHLNQMRTSYKRNIAFHNLTQHPSMFVFVDSSLITSRLIFIVVVLVIWQLWLTVLSLSTVTVTTPHHNTNNNSSSAKIYQICDWWKHCNYLLTCFVTLLSHRIAFFSVTYVRNSISVCFVFKILRYD